MDPTDKAKGGRPSHHDGEIKKAAIAVRTAPSIKAKLEEAAKGAGRSVTQEVEARLTASLMADGGQRSPETDRLLTQIGHAIAEIEAMTGKRWHKDRKTYGALLEMLAADGPAHALKVDDPDDDELVESAWNAYWSSLQNKRALIESLRHLGIIAKMEPYHHPNNALLLAGYTGTSALSGLPPLQGRWQERHALEKEDLPDQAKEVALSLLDGLEELDAKSAKARLRWSELNQPYIEAELAGRTFYREFAQKRKMAKFQ